MVESSTDFYWIIIISQKQHREFKREVWIYFFGQGMTFERLSGVINEQHKQLTQFS